MNLDLVPNFRNLFLGKPLDNIFKDFDPKISTLTFVRSEFEVSLKDKELYHLDLESNVLLYSIVKVTKKRFGYYVSDTYFIEVDESKVINILNKIILHILGQDLRWSWRLSLSLFLIDKNALELEYWNEEFTEFSNYWKDSILAQSLCLGYIDQIDFTNMCYFRYKYIEFNDGMKDPNYRKLWIEKVENSTLKQSFAYLINLYNEEENFLMIWISIEDWKIEYQSKGHVPYKFRVIMDIVDPYNTGITWDLKRTGSFLQKLNIYKPKKRFPGRFGFDYDKTCFNLNALNTFEDLFSIATQKLKIGDLIYYQYIAETNIINTETNP